MPETVPASDEAQLALIASLIYRKFGIYVDKEKYERLNCRLASMIHRGILYRYR